MRGQVQILEEGLFDLSFCLNVGDSKATGKRERSQSCLQMASAGAGRMRRT